MSRRRTKASRTERRSLEERELRAEEGWQRAEEERKQAGIERPLAEEKSEQIWYSLRKTFVTFKIVLHLA